MKILVTGAGGFLGRSIVRSLLAEGETDVRLHFRRCVPPDFLEELRQQYPVARLECKCVNLLARGRLNDLVEGVDCAFHAAAGSRGAPADIFANTVVATRNFLEAACDHDVRRIVLVSSLSVYRTEPLPRGALLDLSVPIESVGVDKGPYGYAKTRQEHVFADFRRRFGFESVVLRPGVIYGPGGAPLSSRVGVRALGAFFSLGGSAPLPLTYVDNCADAVVRAGLSATPGSVFNVVDDDSPSCRAYLRAYRRSVKRLRTWTVPYPVLLLGSRVLVWYNRTSKGQLPAIFTPYSVRSMYKPVRYSNAALKAIGWRQRVSSSDALAGSFRYWRETNV